MFKLFVINLAPHRVNKYRRMNKGKLKESEKR